MLDWILMNTKALYQYMATHVNISVLGPPFFKTKSALYILLFLNRWMFKPWTVLIWSRSFICFLLHLFISLLSSA